MHLLLKSVLENLNKAARKRELRNFEDAQFLLSLGQKDEIPFPVACAIVLSDIALIDGSFDHAEYHFLFAALEEQLGLEAGEAQETVNQARALLGSGRGSTSYAEFIKKNFSLAQREQIYSLIDGMVIADSVRDGFETYLATRLQTALGLGH